MLKSTTFEKQQSTSPPVFAERDVFRLTCGGRVVDGREVLALLGPEVPPDERRQQHDEHDASGARARHDGRHPPLRDLVALKVQVSSEV